MSTDQPTLDDYTDVVETEMPTDVEADEASHAQPSREAMQARHWSPTFRECLGCGADITDPVAWRHGDADQNVIACPDCQPGRNGTSLGTVASAVDSYMDSIGGEQ